MTAPASVIVVSRGRPQALLRCLTGIEQLDHPAFEVVVVADPAGLAALTEAGFDGRIKAVPFDTPNISAARNEGLAQAAGDVAAFIDDDAVPEPTWLRHLCAPFTEADVAAAGGYVRGRNGISFQHRGRQVDALGDHAPLDLAGDTAQVFGGAPGRAIKTEGTNCAFRSDVLRARGGFDPAFRFYLDETDVNLRLARAGARTAIVPLAQVHHGFAASERRRASRMPRDLHEVGASQAVLLRRHAPQDAFAPTLARFRAAQRRRLLRYMVAGLCEPRDVRRLMATLDAGIAEGTRRGLADLPPLSPPQTEFRLFQPRHPVTGMKILAGRFWSRRTLRRDAEHLLRGGERVSLFLFSPTALYHSVTFRPEGYWEQRGGLFGRSDRGAPAFRLTTFGKRLRAEVSRVAPVRIGR